MSFKGFKSILFVIPVCLSLLACSGGGGGAEGGAEGAAGKLNAVDRRVSDWGTLVGLEPAAAQDALDQAGLLDQVGKDAALNEAQVQAFLELTHAKDKTFAQGIEELNRRNQKAFVSFLAALPESNDNFTLQPSFNSEPAAKSAAFLPAKAELPKESNGGFQIGPEVNFGEKFIIIRELRQTALNDYAAMSSQAFALRGRLLDGARVLGLGLQPATMEELLEDRDFASLRDAFAAPVVKAIFTTVVVDINNLLEFAKETNAANRQQTNFGAEPLADVTFKVGGRFLSFYQFNAVVTDSSQAPSIGIIAPGPNGLQPAPPAPLSRGAFKVLAAEENAFPNLRPNSGLEKEDIKK